MNFRTQIEKTEYPFEIEYSDKLFFIGSCFAENISQKLSASGFQCYTNPYGVTYNPLSIIEVLKRVENNLPIEDNLIVEKEASVGCFMMHSDFDAPNREVLTDRVECVNNRAKKCIIESNVVFITLGTAWVYEDINSQKVVNNCHKLPDNRFIRRRLTVDEIINNFADMICSSVLMKCKQIVFTVSPIRHTRDGLVENNLSKSTLICAVHKLCEMFSNVHYFPAYEIVMDDLRDYRFYNADMIHPNDVAVEYIFSYFQKFYFKEETFNYIKQVSKLNSAMLHRPYNQDSEEHKKFKQKMLEKAQQLKKNFPMADLSRYVSFFQS